jgi:hypothetical protein
MIDRTMRLAVVIACLRCRALHIVTHEHLTATGNPGLSCLVGRTFERQARSLGLVTTRRGGLSWGVKLEYASLAPAKEWLPCE